MLQTDKELFVCFAGGTGVRVLHHAKVTERADDLITIRFTDPDGVPTERPEHLTLFFDGPKEFMQQPAQAVMFESVEDPGSEAMLASVHLMGQPVSAESRKCYRVGTMLADYTANFGRLGECKLVDVSAVGVGFLSEQRLALGDQLEIEIKLGAKATQGLGYIQSVKRVAIGYRYGLLCIEDKSKNGLSKTLQQLTMDAQRTQLRRLSGAA